jgi:hypothetical protein
MPNTTPLPERFRKYLPAPPFGIECCEWVGALNGQGYGVIGRGGRGAGNVLAHRLSWELHKGPIPSGLSVLHRCDNPPCVNVDHLFLGTQADNTADMMMKGRENRISKQVGEKHWKAKLTESDVKKIRTLYALGGTTQWELARMFSIRQATISNIILRKIWGHLK